MSGHVVVEVPSVTTRQDEYDPRAVSCSRCGLAAWHPSWRFPCGSVDSERPVRCGIHGTDTRSGRCVDCDREADGRLL